MSDERDSARIALRALRRIGVDLRRHEAGLVSTLFAYSFLLGVFQFSGKAVRDATWVDSLGAERLPYVFLAVAAVAYPVMRIYGNLAVRVSRLVVVNVTALVSAAAMVGFWWAMATPDAMTVAGFYVFISIVSVLGLTQLWSYANSVLDVRQARRLFGFIGSGALLGGVLGGQLTSWAGSTETRLALLFGALSLILIAGLVTVMERRAGPSVSLSGRLTETLAAGAGGADGAPARSEGGFGAILRSPNLRLIAAVMFFSVVASQVVDLQYKWVVEQHTDSLGDRAVLFGNLTSAMALASFLFQLVFTGRIHRSLGVGFAMRVLPSFNLALSVAVLMPGAAPLLIYLIPGMRIGESGLRYSLDHATRELLFVPVDPDERVRAKGYIDLFVHRFAKGAGALLLLPVTFGWLAARNAAWITVVLCVIWLVCTGQAKQRYVAALRSGLAGGRRKRREELVLDLGDVNTLEVLVESLGSPEPEQVVGSIDLLERNRRGHLVPPLLLYHDEPQVRLRTLGVLERTGRRDALPLIEKRIADPVGEVRAAAVRAYAGLANVPIVSLMRERLRDPDHRVRAAAVSCLVADGDEESHRLAEAGLEQLMSDDDPAVRAEAATAISQVREPRLQQRLVRLLYDTDTRVVRAAIEAVRHRAQRDGMNPLFGPILISLLRDRRLKHDAREALVVFGRGVIPSLSHFLREPNEQIWVRRALPKTLARFGGPEAIEALLCCLEDARDPMLRRKVIEALGRCEGVTLDDPRVRRVVVDECRLYAAELLRLVTLSRPEDYQLRGSAWRWLRESPPLLHRLLDERRIDRLGNVLSLLALGGDRAGIESARERLLGDDAAQRMRAAEFLDNVLPESLRPQVMALVDDMPRKERVARLRRLFELEPDDESAADDLEETRLGATLTELLSDPEPGDESSSWLTAAALERVCAERVRALYPRVAALASSSEDELVRETAQWALARTGSDRLAGAGERT